jgi:lysozyme family protein
MSDFNAAIKTVFEHEGGFTDRAQDHGGPTNFGITIQTAADYLKGEPVSADYIKNMTPAIAAAIYRQNYWAPLHLDSIVDERLATVVLDLAVLRGVGAMIRTIESCCKIPQSGKMDAITLAAFQKAASNDPASLALEIVLHCQYLLAQFVVDHPEQIIFLEGWMGRTQELIRLAVS